MNATLRVFLLLLAAMLLTVARASGAENEAPKPEMIGEGVISTDDDEFGGAISNDGNSIYYNITVAPHYLYIMCQAHLVDGKWQKPEVLPFSGLYRDTDPVLTPDGNTLLFASDRPRNGVQSHDFYIWSATKTKIGWTDLHPLDGSLN